MNKQAGIAGGVALGAALMYFLDPNRGKQRRAKVRDQCVNLSSQSKSAIGKVGRDLRDRAVETASTGVKEINHQLETSSLPKFLQGSWTPTVKAIVGTAGGAIAAYALSQTVGGRRVLNGVRSLPPIHR